LSPADRPTYLARACADDLQLRRRVEALLRAHDAPEGFLPEQPGASPLGDAIPATLLAGLPTEQPGDRIGRYKLLQKLGEGGCGMVYMAEQEDPVRRKVALKIIKLGMDTKQVVARFEAERQALALMDHPNIAKVFDAGATETGRPYFVMELVGGTRITDYCDLNHLTTRQRLDLFIQVCRAIQHAHQKGVIHRDIKPSNVLVAMQDRLAVPKVIDFGIAKATQGRLIDRTVFTAFEQFLGTPAYMSPEQAQLGGLDVDTRSDIYSLGVLLYELLTGKTPFDTQEMLAGGLDEIRRTIREKEPARPSTRLSTMAAGELKAAAERRQSDAPRLIHVVRGDLDWIVMKCLEKERARRYETANGLASDVHRHLNHEPVVARPPSKLYEFQKTVRRHKFGFAATAAVIAALSCGIVAARLQAIRALRAEREAQAARLEATRKQLDATKNLWESYLSQARALRLSGQSGRHFESLAALRKAAAIQPSLALRNEAIASMILPDLHWLEKKDFSKAQEKVSLEPTLQKYAHQRTGSVSIRRVADDRAVAALPEVGVPATEVYEFSPDSRFLAVKYADEHWRVWDWAKPAIAAEGVAFLGSAFTSDSRIIGVSDATNIVLYDLISRKRMKSLSLNGMASKDSPGWFRFDPTGRRLALYTTDARTNVFILDTETGETLKTLQHADDVNAVAWHPDGNHLATGCGDKTIHIWDSISGQRLRNWGTGSSVSLGFNHRGDVLASCGWDGYTRLWEFGSGREMSSIYKGGQILHFSMDDLKLATGLWESTGLDFFEVAYGQGLRTLYETSVVSGGFVSSPVTDGGGNLVAFRTHEGIELWDLKTGQRISFLRVDKEKSLVGFDAESHNLILTGRDGLFCCPITGSGEHSRIVGMPILVSTECADPVSGRMGWMSQNGKNCAIVGNHRAQFFRTDTFEKQAETGIQRGMRFSDISSDGSLFASGAWHNAGVKVWNTQTGALVKELPTGGDSATVVFSPDRRHIVTATTYEYCLWEVGSWSLIRRIPQDPDSNFFPMMAFTRDGKILAGAYARHKVRLYNAGTGQPLADLEAPNAKEITGVAFGQDGTQLFIAEAADACRVWDLQLIRQQLAGFGLDWDQPPFPAAESAKHGQGERTDNR